MHRAVRVLAAMAFASCCAHQVLAEESRMLFPVLKGGKWGYIDRTGHYVWKPTE